MIAAFETRLADLLGQRLPAPLAGAVDVAPGRPAARLLVSVTAATPIAEELWHARPERVPGDEAPRRVVNLRCDVLIEAKANARPDRVAALDAALYLLDGPDFQSATALAAPEGEDPGFVIRRLLVSRLEGATSALLTADGLFWPAGIAGQAGAEIRELLLRAPLLPLSLIPAKPVLVAGGAPVDLEIAAANAGGGRIVRDGATPAGPLMLRVRLVDAGGRPGAGELSGGVAVPGGARRIPLAGGKAAVRYTPPAAPSLDLLVVALDREDGQGVELARFALATPAP